jgi:hypothetical protein
LLQALDGEKSLLPAETVRALRKQLAERSPKDAERAAAAVQKLLDAHCLVGVHINPESRVKAARGPLKPALRKDRTTLILVRVHNEAGITPSLAVDGDELIRPGKKSAGRWLEASILREKPFASTLSGRRLEYRVLRLLPRQAGKREATLRFDAGQGTQDLGFRAEVPILFTVKE